ncbi:MAG TPA: ferritin-like domain-containing protein [Thermoanaerobaculia bacterium]|nr:ferritin-like domain-containing protein [Thermoanaerobaculia bacterium]
MIRLRRQRSFPAEELFLSAAVGDNAALADVDRPDEIIPDFQNPYLELVRLLRESAEIEHALMVQYLYSAFSVREMYSGIVGLPVTNGNGLMSVAVQEMQHLHQVTEMLVALGAAPNLVSQAFPYDADVYPFTLHLQRMTPTSLAKYVFTEAAVDAVTRRPGEPDPFLDRLFAELGDIRPNHLGSVYSRVIQLAEQVQENPPFSLPDLTRHIARLRDIKGQGEEAHFRFFKAVFLGQHPGFNGNDRVWQLPKDHPEYPSLPVQEDPSAYENDPEHRSHIPDAETRAMAMLGNLHYWIILMLLDLSYRTANPMFLGIAINHMTSPLLSLGQSLARRGAGLPFDPSNLASSTGRDDAANVRLLRLLVTEAQQSTDNLRNALGDDEADLQILTLEDTLGSLGS